ncbi:protein DpdE [Micromonospora cathayae]|uniref:Protein DpdE n=1 Tax=Micromonospora cathayae TaxID=3028804 RepID=A0ABY7ZS90_9ACTN|nr:protein DpdE [Micromonospora sp. HUAS 3]WDZ84714.1 protein DpdE [Micromonospora sp. HUAS 3]
MWTATQDLGFGRVAAAEGGMAIVEFVDIPGVAVEFKPIPIADLQIKPIPVGSHVWLPGKPYGWISAEVTTWAGYEEYVLHVPGFGRPLKVSAGLITIRWSRPLTDPVAAVVAGFCDFPASYEARRLFRDEMVLQRRMAGGYSAVLSAPVKLYQHQLDTMARVLQDPVPRYLLADEVGLGKTIEAGLILRQLLLDDPGTTALISVPAQLVWQWHTELRDRLALSDALRAQRLRVVSHEQLGAEPRLCDHTMVVIDEAHQLLPFIDGNQSLQQSLTRSQGLLLLSATPVRGGDPETLLRLLHLIDPIAYPLDSAEEFAARLRERDTEASDLQLLRNPRAARRHRSRVLNTLIERHADDPVVARLVAACRLTDDLGAVGWGQLADHVRETYRISRRMIRHRRTAVAATEYPVVGRKGNVLSIHDPARAIVDAFVEQFREDLGDDSDEFFPELVEHALGGPLPLMHYLEARLAATQGPAVVPARFRALFDNMTARLRMSEIGLRLRVAAQLADERMAAGHKVVVAGSPSMAAAFHEMALERWPRRAGGHLESMSAEQRDRDVQDFHRGEPRVLVVDLSAEEGRNLQVARSLINLDLPVDFNRLEQRIGRLDRFGRHSEPAEVVVFDEPESAWVSAYIRLLADGIGIFDRSIATLHAQLGEMYQDRRASMLSDGHRAFELDLEEVRTDLNEELEGIDLVEELESVAVGSDFDDARVAELRESEKDGMRFREAFTKLVLSSGGINLQPSEDDQGIVRFNNARSARYPGLSTDQADEIRPLLSRRVTFNRDLATQRGGGVVPLRIGDPLVDWLAEHLRTDERGRARIFSRVSRGVRFPLLCLAVDFMVEFDPSLVVENFGLRPRLQRRGDALLPPMLLHIRSTADGPLTDARLVREVGAPFDPSRDRAISGTRWDELNRQLPDWQHLCRLGRDEAYAQLRSDPALNSSIREALARAGQEHTARAAILQSRSQRLRGESAKASARNELLREQKLAEALQRGISAPRITAVACGVIVLQPETS